MKSCYIEVEQASFVDNGTELLKEFTLFQNYPNPFNPNTKISRQTIKVYDVLGNEIATIVDEYKPAGKYEVEFNAGNLTSGTYFYKIISDNFAETRKMILLK